MNPPADTDDLEAIRRRRFSHISDDPEVRESLRKLARRSDVGDLDAVARLLLALADGEEPDEDDLEAMRNFARGASSGRAT